MYMQPMQNVYTTTLTRRRHFAAILGNNMGLIAKTRRTMPGPGPGKDEQYTSPARGLNMEV